MNQTVALPHDIDFAQEVRTERLSLLWRVTLVAQAFVFWGVLAASIYTPSGSRPGFWTPLGALVSMTGGCTLTGYLLRRNRYTVAAWSYAGGMIAALAVLLYTPPGLMRDVLPFAFSLLVFVVGLLLPPSAMLYLLIVSIAVVIGVPWMYEGHLLGFQGPQFFALLFCLIAMLLTAQVAGELYAIADWALSNYRRERERKIELHQSQLDLKKTLARARVLAEDLAETNVELEKARRAAEEAKQFRGQFLANMSHELRTPLNAVIGFSDTMLNFPEMYNDVPLPPEYRQDMGQIYTSGTQLLHVINDILDLSRVDVGKLEVILGETELRPIFYATLTTATGLVGEKPIRLRKVLPPELPKVWADANRVRQVLLNLYSNAAKFTDEGHITLGLTTSNGEAIISVADTGCGIPPEEYEIIFEEFRQGQAGLRKQHAGAGVGLSITRHLLALMNGRIWLESEVNVGTTFYFSLPLVGSEKEAMPAGHMESVATVPVQERG